MRKASWFNVGSVALGLAFLYLPIVILVIYSFNASRLVTVWGGWSTRWYVELLADRAMLESAWVTLRIAVLSATAATVLGTLAAIALVRLGGFRGRLLFSGMVYAPLVMPEVITGLALLLLFVAADVRYESRRSGDESRLPAVENLSHCDPAVDRARTGVGLDARLHAITRRSRGGELHHRSRRNDAADPDLFGGSPRRETGDQRHLLDPDRNRCNRHCRRVIAREIS